MEQELEKRISQLREIDMIFDPRSNTYIGETELNSDFNVHVTELRFDNEDTWRQKVQGMTEELNRRKNQN